MKKALEGFYAYLSGPIGLWSRPVLALLVVPLALAIAQPLWHIELQAPQYPAGLTVDIYAHAIRSGHDDRDLSEINILNHYIGMHKLDRAAFTELDWLPFAFGALILFALRVAAIGDMRMLVDLAVVTGYFAVFSAARFVYKLYNYGHDLAPDAPVKVQPFMPAIAGTKQIGNFTTHASFGTGTYLFVLFVLGVTFVTVFHLVQGYRNAHRS
jgi:hypothetical protein